MKTKKHTFQLRRLAYGLFSVILAFSAVPVSSAYAATEQYDWQLLAPTTNAVSPGAPGISGDGMTMYIPVEGDGTMFYSQDKGVTWQKRPHPSSDLWDMAVSADGTKVVGIGNGNVFISEDSSQTWSAAIPVGCSSNEIDMSSDGMNLVVACSSGYLYTSTNGGYNWVQRTGAGSRNWNSVAISADGTKMVAAYSRVYSSILGYIYTSSDGGATWVQQVGAGERYWTSVDVSSDGSKVVATALTAQSMPLDIYRSTDGGAVWTVQSGLGQIAEDSGSGILISSDGQTVVVTDRPTENPTIRVSIDGGDTWAYSQEFETYYYVQGVGLSSDGQTIIMPSQSCFPAIRARTGRLCQIYALKACHGQILQRRSTVNRCG